MSDPLYRAERCRDLAEECRRLAASTLSDQMKKRYLLMAKDYTLLADLEKHGRACRTECLNPEPAGRRVSLVCAGIHA